MGTNPDAEHVSSGRVRDAKPRRLNQSSAGFGFELDHFPDAQGRSRMVKVDPTGPELFRVAAQ